MNIPGMTAAALSSLALWVCPSAGQPASRPAGAKETPAVSAPAAPGAARDISASLAPVVEKYKIPCIAAAMVSTDTLEAVGAAGVRVMGHPEKITAQDQFHLGSCTKAMTATLIAILVEEGRLRWDMTLPEALPAMKDAIHEKYRGVTIKDLLTQRSGVPTEMNKDGLWARLYTSPAPIIDLRDDCTKTMLSWGPDHDREKFVYANANFIIAGHIAEVATAKPWEDLIKEKLFEPLGMASAGFGAPGGEGEITQPQGHTPEGKPVGVGVQADNPKALGPAGTVHASLEDWGKFISFHLRAAAAAREGKDITIGAVTLHPETVRMLHTPVKGNGADYAMGWGVAERPWAKGADGASTVLTHSGSNTMWFCVVWAAPDAGFAVMAATNIMGNGAQQACDQAVSTLIMSRRGGGGAAPSSSK